MALGLTVLCGQLLMASNSFAEDNVSTQARVSVTSTCGLTAVQGSAHEATITAGTYQSGIGETTITALCNDANGYAVYAVGYTNTEFGRNDMLGQTTGRTIATGTATSGDTSNWAMMLTAVDNSVAPTIATGFNVYHAVPSEFTKVASYSNTTTTNPAGSSFKTTYATFVAGAQAADDYYGKVKYTLVHPADTANTPCVGNYTINYNSNGGSGNMDSQTACVDRYITLLPNGFTPATPSEYQFYAWNTEADGSGNKYLPGQSVMNLGSVEQTVVLYAQWVPKYMQDLTNAMCQSLATTEPLTVYDRRDDNNYTVRWIQGACWMTQNLRITGTVNAQNSNFSTYSNVDVCESSIVGGHSYDQPQCHDSGNTENGVWYNYAAASAKTILGNSNSLLATEDICPLNWRLPDYDTTSPVGSINSLNGIDSVGLTAFSPVVGGDYLSGSPNNLDSGSWWSTAASEATRRYRLYYKGNKLSISTFYRDTGNYIRCVLK